MEHLQGNSKSLKKNIEDSFKSFMAKHFNKGPLLAKVYMVDNCITIYCKEVLTPLEKNIVRENLGEYYVQIFRKKLSYSSGDILIGMIEQKTGRKVNTFFIDCNAVDDSLCCVFIMEGNIEN